MRRVETSGFLWSVLVLKKKKKKAFTLLSVLPQSQEQRFQSSNKTSGSTCYLSPISTVVHALKGVWFCALNGAAAKLKRGENPPNQHPQKGEQVSLYMPSALVCLVLGTTHRAGGQVRWLMVEKNSKLSIHETRDDKMALCHKDTPHPEDLRMQLQYLFWIRTLICISHAPFLPVPRPHIPGCQVTARCQSSEAPPTPHPLHIVPTP